MRWLLTLVLVSGCHKLFDLEPVTLDDDPTGDGGTRTDGRVSGDAFPANCPITPPQFDEDSDTIDDRCDPCPTVAFTSDTDTDLDGLPDDCDPNPTSTAEEIVFFRGFAVESDLDEFDTTTATWDAMKTGTVTLDPSSQLRTIAPYAPARVEVRFAGMSVLGPAGQVTVGTTSVKCAVTAGTCAGLPNSMCVRVTPTTQDSEAELGSPSTALVGVVLTAIKTPGSSCEVIANGDVEATSDTTIGIGNVQVEVNETTVATTVQSVTVYAAR